jgi:hypothetical protein
MLPERHIDKRDVVVIEGPPDRPRGRLIWRPIALITDVDIAPSIVSRKVAIRLTDRAMADALSRFPTITEAVFLISPSNMRMRSFADLYHATAVPGELMISTIRG